MYTPPQECLETLLGPQEVPSTFLFSPTGLGAKERRERWIWRDQAASRALRESHPFSYTYIVEDGRLATIAENRPEHRRPTQQRQKSCRQPLDRHSSPVLACGFPMPNTQPESGRVIKRALSLTFSTQSHDELSMYRPTTVAAMKQRALPDLPNVTAPALSASDTSDFPKRMHYRRPAQFSYDKAPPSPPPTFELPPTPRRSFEEPRPAPLPPSRSPSQKQGALPTPPASPTAVSRELSVKASNPPQKLRRKISKTSKFIELVEDRLRPVLPVRASSGKASPLSPPPCFHEERIPPMPALPRDLILPPASPESLHVSFAANSPHHQQKSHPNLRIDSAIGSYRSPHSSAHNSARSSLHRDIDQHTSIEMCNLIGSKATASILESRGLIVSPTHPPTATTTKLQRRVLKKQMSLPRIIIAPYRESATPTEDYMMSGGLAPERSTSVSSAGSSAPSHLSSAVSQPSSASSLEETVEVPIRYHLNEQGVRTFLPVNIPRRSASTASASERPVSTATTLSNFVCTAEAKPIALKSPVVAMGSARLISC